jgi:hypothetical protein
VRSLAGNLSAAAPGMPLAAMLTEGDGYDAFGDWQRDPASLADAGVSLEATDDDACVRLRCGNGQPVHVFAGRQIVTRERVEILSLLSTARIDDGMPAGDTVRAILDSGAIAVASWAPGKWFPPRSRTIRDLIETFSPEQLRLGDSSLRATVWPTPLLMDAGRRKGLTVLAGSDPLPFPGDERLAGCYASRLDADWDADRPVSSLKEILLAGAPVTTVGKRVSAVTMLRRLHSNARAKR